MGFCEVQDHIDFLLRAIESKQSKVASVIFDDCLAGKRVWRAFEEIPVFLQIRNVESFDIAVDGPVEILHLERGPVGGSDVVDFEELQTLRGDGLHIVNIGQGNAEDQRRCDGGYSGICNCSI